MTALALAALGQIRFQEGSIEEALAFYSRVAALEGVPAALKILAQKKIQWLNAPADEREEIQNANDEKGDRKLAKDAADSLFNEIFRVSAAKVAPAL